jgi:hypothetical protein
MYCRVLNSMSTDVSEVSATSMISAIMMEESRAFETSVDIVFTTRQYIPQDSELHVDSLILPVYN